MTEQEFLTSTDPAAMLAWVIPDGEISGRSYVSISDRKCRLFACACVRQGLTNPPELLKQELAYLPQVEELADNPNATEADYVAIDQLLIGSGARWAQHHAHLRRERSNEQARKATLLRCIVGNPFRPPKNVRAFGGLMRVEWLTDTVVALARAAYSDRPGRRCERCNGTGHIVVSCTFPFGPHEFYPCKRCHGTGTVEDGLLDPQRLQVLADALLDAGCPETEVCPECKGEGRIWYHGYKGPRTTLLKCETCLSGDDLYCGSGRVPNPLLAHLRSPGPHVRGCWSIDLLLGKS